MKKLISLCLMCTMILATFSTPTYANSENGMKGIPLNQEFDNVIEISNDQIELIDNVIDSTPDLIDDFFKTDGIIIVRGDETTPPIRLDEKLELPVRQDSVPMALNSNDDLSEVGVDIATIYYQQGNVMGVHEINVDSDSVGTSDSVINEVVNEIRANQADPSQSMEQARSLDSNELIGEKNYTVVRSPRGKMTAYYDIYSVQNHNTQDYYIVKANITGMPGADLGGSYETKYKGETLDVIMDTSSTDIILEAFGPERSVTNSSIGIELGGSIEEDKITGSGSLSYTHYFDDTEVDVSVRSPEVEWNVSMSGDAKESAAIFKPGINFGCPQNKSSIRVSTSADYTVDSWNTLPYVISLNKTFTCYPTSVN